MFYQSKIGKFFQIWILEDVSIFTEQLLTELSNESLN
jgi:hypothetical protein